MTARDGIFAGLRILLGVVVLGVLAHRVALGPLVDNLLGARPELLAIAVAAPTLHRIIGKNCTGMRLTQRQSHRLLILA